MPQPVVDYIAAARAKGASDDVIHSKLLSAGWSAVEVDESFRGIRPAPPVVQPLDDSSFLRPSQSSYVLKSSPNVFAGRPVFKLPKLSIPGLGIASLSLPSGWGVVASWLSFVISPLEALKGERYRASAGRTVLNFTAPWLLAFTLYFILRLADASGGLAGLGVGELALMYLVVGMASTLLIVNLGFIASFLSSYAARLVGVKVELGLHAHLFSVVFVTGAVLLFVDLVVQLLLPEGLQAAYAVARVLMALYWLALLALACRESTGAPIPESIAAASVPTAALFSAAYFGLRLAAGA